MFSLHFNTSPLLQSHAMIGWLSHNLAFKCFIPTLLVYFSQCLTPVLHVTIYYAYYALHSTHDKYVASDHFLDSEISNLFDA